MHSKINTVNTAARTPCGLKNVPPQTEVESLILKNTEFGRHNFILCALFGTYSPCSQSCYEIELTLFGNYTLAVKSLLVFKCGLKWFHLFRMTTFLVQKLSVNGRSMNTQGKFVSRLHSM